MKLNDEKKISDSEDLLELNYEITNTKMILEEKLKELAFLKDLVSEKTEWADRKKKAEEQNFELLGSSSK